ncbi:MAG: hypoxanthine phosphoribosyltransferase [Opitutae bacterium]|nr:hypoxanthine phosphoribosyltransferase [Opitutae bacterium]
MNLSTQPVEILSAERIAERVTNLAKQINQFYQGREILLVSILDGAIIFTADLLRQLRIPTQLDCMRISSYGSSTSPESAPQITGSLKSDLRGKHVLLVDDILDTGNTLQRACEEIKSHHPDSIKTCVFLDKAERRTNHFQADWVGFSIPNEFVVGYGLDFDGHYRELPYLGKLPS